MTKWKTYTGTVGGMRDSMWITPEDLEESGPVVVTITGVEENTEPIKWPSGETAAPGSVRALRIKGTNRMVRINKQIREKLRGLYGVPAHEKWPNHQVRLVVAEVTAFGKRVKSIQVEEVHGGAGRPTKTA